MRGRSSSTGMCFRLFLLRLLMRTRCFSLGLRRTAVRRLRALTLEFNFETQHRLERPAPPLFSRVVRSYAVERFDKRFLVIGDVGVVLNVDLADVLCDGFSGETLIEHRPGCQRPTDLSPHSKTDSSASGAVYRSLRAAIKVPWRREKSVWKTYSLNTVRVNGPGEPAAGTSCSQAITYQQLRSHMTDASALQRPCATFRPSAKIVDAGQP